MAKFIGTEIEFLDLFGSTLLTNAVKSYIPKSMRKKVCINCKKPKEVQAAHRHGTPDRLEIAKEILSMLPHNEKDEVIVDMHVFLKEFYKKHLPLDEHFIFLCDPCHKEYDKNKVKQRRPKGSNVFCGYGKPKNK